MSRQTLLEDSFEYKQVPFIVRVEVQDRYINGRTGETRGKNMYGAPAGLRRSSRAWTLCECVIARVRPDYPYSIRREWPENVEKHFHTVVPLEIPVKNRLLLIARWSAERTVNIEEIDVEKMAEVTIEKMKDAYENRNRVKSLE